MSIDPREVAALAILAQAPERNGHIVESLSGNARKIGEAMVNPNHAGNGRIDNAARAIKTWADSNKR